jgi:hypothetical protein
MGLDTELGRWQLLRPFLAVVGVVVSQFALILFDAAASGSDQGPPTPCLGAYYGDGNTCYATWGGWSLFMYAPELGIAAGIVFATTLRRSAARWILALGGAGVLACGFALAHTHGGATWQMPIP